MPFHITKAGEPARCGATTRACPLGGTHYDSMEEASMASFDHFLASEFEEATQAHAAHWDQNIGEVDALFTAEELAFGDEDEVAFTGVSEEEARAYVAAHPGSEFSMRPNGDPMVIRKYSDNPTELMWTVVPDEEIRASSTVTPHDPDEDSTGDSIDDDDIADLLDEWDEEEEVLRYQVEADRELNPVTEDELEAFQTAEDEATRIVQTAAKGVELDRSTSVTAAEELQSYRGMKTLDLLAADLADQAHEDFAAGRISQEELEEAVHVAGALRFLLSPSEGRRHTAREARPIDPELIQALRCLYMKRFGVDPFEQGVSVPQLLQMRQQRLI